MSLKYLSRPDKAGRVVNGEIPQEFDDGAGMYLNSDSTPRFKSTHR